MSQYRMFGGHVARELRQQLRMLAAVIANNDCLSEARCCAAVADPVVVLEFLVIAGGRLTVFIEINAGDRDVRISQPQRQLEPHLMAKWIFTALRWRHV